MALSLRSPAKAREVVRLVPPLPGTRREVAPPERVAALVRAACASLDAEAYARSLSTLSGLGIGFD